MVDSNEFNKTNKNFSQSQKFKNFIIVFNIKAIKFLTFKTSKFFFY